MAWATERATLPPFRRALALLEFMHRAPLPHMSPQRAGNGLHLFFPRQRALGRK